jgi:hypothetical protein
MNKSITDFIKHSTSHAITIEKDGAATRLSVEWSDEGAAKGAVAGAAVAGPPGAAAGFILGGIFGPAPKK